VSTMEWTSCQKSTVKQLLAIVARHEHHSVALEWAVHSVLIVEKGLTGNWDTWHIAQALLLAQTSQWPTDVWRQKLGLLRHWQKSNSSAITRISEPARLYELCWRIKESGMFMQTKAKTSS
jgi:hypothetical protein